MCRQNISLLFSTGDFADEVVTLQGKYELNAPKVEKKTLFTAKDELVNSKVSGMFCYIVQ